MEPADDDYLTARLLWNYDRVRGFGWSAGQALEKYFKAALLLNGRAARFSHDFASKGYSPLKEVAGTLLPDIISVPKNSPFAGHESKLDRSVHQTLLRFERNGTPQTRYGEHGYRFESYDLHLFDSLCHMLRRLCISLEAVSEGRTWRQRLTEEPRLQWAYYFDPLQTPRVPKELNLKNHLLFGNFEFESDPICFGPVSRTAFRIDGDAPYSSPKDTDAVLARRYLMQNSLAKPRAATLS